VPEGVSSATRAGGSSQVATRRFPVSSSTLTALAPINRLPTAETDPPGVTRRTSRASKRVTTKVPVRGSKSTPETVPRPTAIVVTARLVRSTR